LVKGLVVFPLALNQRKELSGMDQERKAYGRNSDIERRNLLAKIHIARNELCWSDIQYRLLIESGFGVPTAAALTNEQLKQVVAYFMREGWRPEGGHRSKQVSMLQRRAIDFIPQIPGGKRRIEGLCRKLCDVEKVEWCNDVSKLKRLLAVMGNIKRKEGSLPIAARAVG